MLISLVMGNAKKTVMWWQLLYILLVKIRNLSILSVGQKVEKYSYTFLWSVNGVTTLKLLQPTTVEDSYTLSSSSSTAMYFPLLEKFTHVCKGLGTRISIALFLVIVKIGKYLIALILLSEKGKNNRDIFIQQKAIQQFKQIDKIRMY